ncbi:hypothetical protein Tco_0799465 [Tanacetum coccineum]|uniref:F-box domain-containing protein n=1 Tax=Tanacetum coccineum TaxID=301880 RepID=A0ABQ4ZTN5_9ASTR
MMTQKHKTHARENSAPPDVVLTNDDLLTEILIRLPILCIHLFTTISKQWLRILTSLDFIRNRSQITKVNPSVGLFINHIRSLFECDFVSLDSRLLSKKSAMDNSFTLGSTKEAKTVKILDDIGSSEFTIYEMMIGCSFWTVRYRVGTDDFMTPLLEAARPKTQFKTRGGLFVGTIRVVQVDPVLGVMGARCFDFDLSFPVESELRVSSELDFKKRFDADVRATNIVHQGLPKDIYKLINHNIKAKAIRDNVKMLLARSELTKEDRESQLYDEFERFKMLPGENINEFVTAVKLNKCLKETNHEQLYAFLKQHEKHAAQDRLIIERITPPTNDPLAFVSSVQPYTQPSQSQSLQYQSSTTPS